MTRLKIGTRGSPLALVQTRLAHAAIAAAQPGRIEVVTFDTRGDLDRSKPIEALGGRGVFTDELDKAVLDGVVDVAVHSVKDLPVPLPKGLVLAATLKREDPREAFVSPRYASLDDVPVGGVLGSASVRREALVRALRPDLAFGLLRGNVDERIAALERSELDGTILAVAGLKRLGLTRHIRDIFPPDVLMPDPGQGAIGLVCRANDASHRLLLKRVNHAPTLQAVTAERTLLAALGGRFIIGALASVASGTMTLAATATLPNGNLVWRGSVQGSTEEAVAIAHKLAAGVPAFQVSGGCA